MSLALTESFHYAFWAIARLKWLQIDIAWSVDIIQAGYAIKVVGIAIGQKI